MVRPTVLAFGGNALLPDPKNPGRQEETADAFARAVRLLMTDDAGMVLVHGNGPQVGMILLRIEATKDRIPPETLDVMVAETEGSIGYLLARTLRNRIPKKEIAAVLTQVTVDPDDPGVFESFQASRTVLFRRYSRSAETSSRVEDGRDQEPRMAKGCTIA